MRSHDTGEVRGVTRETLRESPVRVPQPAEVRVDGAPELAPRITSRSVSTRVIPCGFVDSFR